MAELHAYLFRSRTGSGVLFGLSAVRLVTVAAAAVVFVVTMLRPTPATAAAGLLTILALLSAVAVRVSGRAVVDWIPVWIGFGWRMATRNNEFYASPDLHRERGLPDGTLDLPGELFGIELHDHCTIPAADSATPAGYGVVRDTFRRRLVAVVEVSGGDFLFGDPDEQQQRISAWGRVMDHVAQSLPDLRRLQVLHIAGPSTVHAPDRDQEGTSPEGPDGSYRQVVARAADAAQEHRLLIAVALDLPAARRAIRQAGGGIDGATRVLLDRATTIEQTLQSAGLTVHGWLSASALGQVLRNAFDPHHPQAEPCDTHDNYEIGPGSTAFVGPAGLVEGWSAVRHDGGWSTTLQIAQPPSRPVTGDFLQHLLIGVPARRRLSILYVPTPLATAERRAQTQQVSTESEQTLRARWGFGTSARQRREHQDAAQREEDLVSGRTVYRVVWLLTVTADHPTTLDQAVGQVEAAARRCGLDLRRLAGTQRQALGHTLPLCRGAR